MPGIRPAPGEIPQKAMAYILQGLCTISYGEMVLVAQDGVLMQVEWSEKRRLDQQDHTEKIAKHGIIHNRSPITAGKYR